MNYTEKFLVGEPTNVIVKLLGTIPSNSLLSNIDYNISTVDLAFSSDENQGSHIELAIQRFSNNQTITLWTSNKLWCGRDTINRTQNYNFTGLSSSKTNTISLQQNDMINIILTSIDLKHYPVITDIKINIELIKMI